MGFAGNLSCWDTAAGRAVCGAGSEVFQSLNRELLEKRCHPTQQACDSAAAGRERAEPEDWEPFALAGELGVQE